MVQLIEIFIILHLLPQLGDSTLFDTWKSHQLTSAPNNLQESDPVLDSRWMFLVLH